MGFGTAWPQNVCLFHNVNPSGSFLPPKQPAVVLPDLCIFKNIIKQKLTPWVISVIPSMKYLACLRILQCRLQQRHISLMFFPPIMWEGLLNGWNYIRATIPQMFTLVNTGKPPAVWWIHRQGGWKWGRCGGGGEGGVQTWCTFKNQKRAEHCWGVRNRTWHDCWISAYSLKLGCSLIAALGLISQRFAGSPPL